MGNRVDDIVGKIAAFILQKPIAALAVPTAAGLLGFIGNLCIALSDGNIDTNELHQLLSGANGIEAIALVAIMAALKISSKKPKDE